ncbi:hypothetical protein [Ideonella oryzae]|uniref:Lipoprotein n=1 Tax=Ideonella oryzae TaxID=2937441 RepID=A0ABT1BJ72_9BURK|nr:hypothetical protein [Ideonella oryzae]MCO5976262.1 hypothetical protein [Ideonella oryzae]
MSRRFSALLVPILATGCLCALGGCAVVEVAGAATGAVISVGASVVSTGITVTGKAVGAGIDAVSGGDKPAP